MTTSTSQIAGTAVGWAIISLTLVFSTTLGSASSVLTLLLCLTLLPVAWRPSVVDEVRKAPAQMIFIGVVAVLALLYALSARRPTDMLFFANFLAMPLSALVYVIALSQRGRKNAVLVLRLCVLGAVVGLGFALFDIGGRGLDRAQGLIGNPNLMPRLALTLGFISLAGMLIDDGWRGWLYLVGPAASVFTTVLTSSRGAALAIPVLVLIPPIVLWHQRRSLSIIAAGALSTLLGGGLGFAVVGAEVLGRLAGIGETIGAVLQNGESADGSTIDRLAMYQAGISAFFKSPWIGAGWANLGNVAAETNPGAFAGQAGTLFMFHNDAINFAVAGGVAGLACLVALLVAPVVGAQASPRDQYFPVRLYCCAILSAGYLIFGLTDSTLGYDAPTTLYAFLTAMVLGAFRADVRASAGGPAARP